VPPFPHLASCTITKSKLYLANSLATVVCEPHLYRLLPFHVPNLMSVFHCLGRIKIPVHVRGTCIPFVKRPVFKVRGCYHLAQTAIWRTTPCQLFATAYSIYSQPSYILEAVPPSATWGRAMPWWQGPTYYGRTTEGFQGRFIKLTVSVPLRVEKNTPVFKKCIAIEMKRHNRNI
jgi:hypothetical protein